MDNSDYIEFEDVRRYQPDALHKRMLQRITELEALVQTKQTWIEDATGLLQRIRGLLQEDPPWMPIAPGKIYVDGLVIINFFDDRMTVQHAENAPIMVYLEPDIRMCRKVQPAP